MALSANAGSLRDRGVGYPHRDDLAAAAAENEAGVEQRRADGDPHRRAGGAEAGEAASGRGGYDSEHDQDVPERPASHRAQRDRDDGQRPDRKSTRLNSSHLVISYA